MASPSRQIGDVSFVTNSNNNNHLKLFLHSESRGNMKTLTLSLASHIIVVCGVSLTLSTTALRSQPPHQLQVRGWPGATRPRTWFHLTQHFKLWVNYISLSAQVGILCVFLTTDLSGGSVWYCVWCMVKNFEYLTSSRTRFPFEITTTP